MPEAPTATFDVYISESNSDPDSGTEHTNYIRFICSSLSVSFINKNTKEDLPAHQSLEVKIGEMIYSASFENCIFTRVDVSATGQTAWNDFVEFVGNHCKPNANSIYGWVRMQMGNDSDSYWLRWFDNTYAMQKYMKCRISQFTFHIEATSQMAKGTLKIEEVWKP